MRLIFLTEESQTGSPSDSYGSGLGNMSKTDLEEAVQIRMRGRVDCGLEERLEEVLDDVLEAGDLVVQLVDVIQPGDLDQPQRVVRINLV